MPNVNDGVQTYELGNFELKCGVTLPNAFVAYKTFGDPSLPAIMYPTWYSGSIADNEWLIGEDMELSPKKYFVIIVAMFGNGQSSSPSNQAAPMNGPNFPYIAVADNVRAQYTLVTEKLGIKHLHAVVGWSMGAGQTYQWGVSYPDFMDYLVPFCGSARTAIHNKVFLESIKAALTADTEGFKGGNYGDKKPEVGLKAFGRVYAGWGFSQAWYREEIWKTQFGFKTLEEFLVGFWEAWALSKDANNLLCMLETWKNGDISAGEPFNGDFEAALRSIKAKTLVLPGHTDLYFPPEDSQYEAEHLNDGICESIPSIWGHWAGGPGDSKEDVRWLDERLSKFLNGKG
ncbi:homoserine acetyltransferase family protein [Saitoella complicata NRRL Y-17804]|uniref:AB hydrolase-1 domain-containing protein n=1 Tax=Saitoella complicata (strain BCRC 22490 / CBS 7301 / JCM 7358 / NBRC 10748 / NRRL Y-17804) TaxID=698492 RepID=A0A0E9NR89_SAICN|nr:homoserine acetyltransferase family protein [Saitoella complicata NRRL Y-17804]ODQ52654.1 homoserine acetyltransferase family protein [Saitoella complicata NRRL Y-17804]GAO52364.1 hypothetical protein G7K_6442-t1 [Saitoella complicata NRRL Y-17804]